MTNKNNIMMIYHIPFSSNRSRASNEEKLHSLYHYVQDANFYSVQVFPYIPGKDEKEDIKIEIIDLKNIKQAKMSVLDELLDTSEYYFNYEKWLRKQKIKRLNEDK